MRRSQEAGQGYGPDSQPTLQSTLARLSMRFTGGSMGVAVPKGGRKPMQLLGDWRYTGIMMSPD